MEVNAIKVMASDLESAITKLIEEFEGKTFTKVDRINLDRHCAIGQQDLIDLTIEVHIWR